MTEGTVCSQYRGKSGEYGDLKGGQSGYGVRERGEIPEWRRMRLERWPEAREWEFSKPQVNFGIYPKSNGT